LGIPPYVVRITGKSQAGQGFNGTGFIVSPKGHIVTCCHVVVQNGQPATSIKISLAGYPEPWEYAVRDLSNDNDLALLEGVVPPSHETPHATLHPHWHRDARIGQQVAIFGHSSADNYPGGQLYTCNISGFSEKDGRVGVVGDINPGDSGGPVLDDQQRVIGIVHAKDRRRDGHARFIPASLLIDLLARNQISFPQTPQLNHGAINVDYTPNPFTSRKGINRADAFFNRENEKLILRDFIHTQQNCQIVGPRRIGKTSLLLEVERSIHNWEERAVIAYVDLHDVRCNTLEGWLGRVSKKLSWAQPATSLGEFNDYIEEMVSQDVLPVLCLDEFEEFTMRREQFNRDFFMNLRHAGNQGMAIITASQAHLNKLTDPDDPTSPFYNTFPPLKLGPFEKEDVDDFLSLLRPNVSPFEPAEKEAIRTFSKGYPLALQVACFHVVNCKRSGLSLGTAMERAMQDLKFYWKPDTQITNI
jgi:uncharacterized protein